MATETPTTGTPTAAPETTEEKKKRSWGDAYTWMLVLSLLFITIGCGMLLLEWSQYNFMVRPVGF